MNVTHEDVKQMARLSKLYIEDTELEELTEAMNQIIAFADTINAAATGDSSFDDIHFLQNVLREDEVVPSYPREEILYNAESQDDGYFLVKKRA
jgi:aspartyl-tRNA(Asn)/glutamyl-tRNA(Gln) amidotransferase subunit C